MLPFGYIFFFQEEKGCDCLPVLLPGVKKEGFIYYFWFGLWRGWELLVLSSACNAHYYVSPSPIDKVEIAVSDKPRLCCLPSCLVVFLFAASDLIELL